eukprot:CAMPEP_0181295736 /NCGR_PEP_ID=MMETSP1101-20121128/4309_1 /TAXON_ID=46948 /ORGANISM="Rhodomonas abbreviata, Strain Caron Lab Isolate" /LENGTH=202 /DNA_ID=CAMNT_0023400513 /DNA_START=524 /DNA_END=1132 /DNA_ORIENTATION=+
MTPRYSVTARSLHSCSSKEQQLGEKKWDRDLADESTRDACHVSRLILTETKPIRDEDGEAASRTPDEDAEAELVRDADGEGAAQFCADSSPQVVRSKPSSSCCSRNPRPDSPAQGNRAVLVLGAIGAGGIQLHKRPAQQHHRCKLKEKWAERGCQSLHCFEPSREGLVDSALLRFLQLQQFRLFELERIALERVCARVRVCV